MASQIIIKRSPAVVLRTFALIEIAAMAAYWLAAGHGNYKYDVYNQIAILPSLLSYQTAKFLVLSGAQFVITIYAFFRWYYETYTISAFAAVHRYGVFFKKQRVVALDKSMTLTATSSPFGKLWHYGSIRAASRDGFVVLADISYPQMQLRAIEKLSSGGVPDIAKLIAQDEHEQLEFKSSFRFDRKQGAVNHAVEKAAMKTIAAFMNSRGGNLVLGVGDGPMAGGGVPDVRAARHEVVGLKADYETLPRKDSDGFENHFTQVFNKTLGPDIRNLVRLHFQSLDGRDVCLVRVAESARPVYLKMDDNEYFYVRTGNGTTPLKLSEVETYSRSRWPRRTTVS